MKQAQKGFDLSTLDTAVDKPVTFDVAVIVDPDGNPISGFRIVGRNSTEYRTADKAVRVENQKAAASRSKAIDQKTEEGAEKVVDIVDRQTLARTAAVCVDWFGFESSGKPAKFDAKVVRKMLEKFPTWQEKIMFALSEDNNFLTV
jgi:hypothetical protein